MSPVELEIEILDHIRAACAAHADECDQPPKAILLNPGNYQLVGSARRSSRPKTLQARLRHWPRRLLRRGRCVLGRGRRGLCGGATCPGSELTDLVVEVRVREQLAAVESDELVLEVHGTGLRELRNATLL
jgi:hypothetical protein